MPNAYMMNSVLGQWVCIESAIFLERAGAVVNLMYRELQTCKIAKCAATPNLEVLMLPIDLHHLQRIFANSSHCADLYLIFSISQGAPRLFFAFVTPTVPIAFYTDLHSFWQNSRGSRLRDGFEAHSTIVDGEETNCISLKSTSELEALLCVRSEAYL